MKNDTEFVMRASRSLTHGQVVREMSMYCILICHKEHLSSK